MDSFFIKIADIFQYLEALPSSRCVSEGQAVLNAGHIILCGIKERNMNKLVLYALCLKTSKLTDTPHQLGGIVSVEEGTVSIKEMSCSCKAGKSSRCKHVAALLLLCSRQNILDLEDLSSTDVDCYWRKEKLLALENYKPVPFLETDCMKKNKPGKSCVAVEKECIESKSSYILQKLCASAPNSELSKHGKRKRKMEAEKIYVPKDATLELLFRNMDDSLAMKEIPKKVPSRECCQIQYHNIESSNYLQVAQTSLNNRLVWVSERKLRITGSRCYELFTYSKGDWHTKSQKYFWPKGFSNKFVRHGIEMEPEARAVYATRNQYDVKEVGLIISKHHPWLAYSPDGIVMGPNGPSKLLEIKCPYIGKTKPAIDFINSCDFLVFENNFLALKKKHKFYGQVQLGMAILNLPLCDFVVYSSFSKGFLNIVVKYDHKFALHMITRLQSIYFESMLHELCLNEESMHDA